MRVLGLSFFGKMSVRVLLFCMFLMLTSGEQKSSGAYREPACAGMAEILACPMNLAPVCGSDGNTYANECALCVQRLQTKSDILITKDGNC